MAVLGSVLVLVFALGEGVPQLAAGANAAQTTEVHSQHPARDAGNRTLLLPHALRKGETAWLLVEVGSIGHHEIQLTTQDGHPLGTISPFAVKPKSAQSDEGGATYTVPIPAEDFAGKRLALQIAVKESDRVQHAPSSEEVKSLHLAIRRFPGAP